jgi:hypothetical protein
VNSEISELRDSIYRELALRDQSHSQVHTADQEALHTAYQNLGHRLEALNNSRQILFDQSSEFVTRVEEDVSHKAMLERIEQLAQSIRVLEMSHSTLQARLYTIVSVVTVAITIISVLMKFSE